MSRFIKLAGGLFLFTLVLASCGFFGQGEQAQVAESTPNAPVPTATQAPPTVTHTAIPLNPTVASSPTTATATEIPPTATPTEVPPTRTVTANWTVGNTGGEGVYIRRTADMDDRIKAWPDGTEMVVVGPDVTAEDILWKNVRDPDGNAGFVPAEYLIAPQAPETTPTATTTPSADSAEPTPVPETPEVTYVVGNTDGSGVYIRLTIDAADRIKAWPDGTEMVVVGPDVTAEDILWKNVRDPDGNAGFVPAEFLVLPERESTEANETAAPATGDAPATPSRPLKDDPL